MNAPRDAMTDAIPPVIAAALGPGAMIAGRYRLEARLGTGGGGTVWRCLDDKLGEIVALKIVSSDGDLERWRREVAMARRIANRNVCRVHDLGETAELRYVTMELVQGDSLRARLTGDLPAATARDLFAQIVAGTAAIHAAGVVHRDLKPENIVVARDGRAVIVDFGLAREPRVAGAAPDGGVAPPDAAAATVELRGPVEPTPRGSPTSATVTGVGAIVGTPRYMSPEQAAGQPVDTRTDVWALGLIGHELMTGRLPPPDEHGRQVDPAVDAAWPGIAAVLRRCLAFLPEERLADARRVEHALAAIGGRRWIVRGAVAAVALAAIGGGGVAVREVMRDEPSDSTVPPRMVQLTTTEPKKWPADAPISVALAPDASQFAYTTADSRLLVRPIGAGTPVVWSMPSLDKPRSRPTDAPESTLVTMSVIGWFSDGSLAVVGAERDNRYQLDRVYRDGRTQLLYRYAQRFTAAVTPVGDRVAVGVSDHAMLVIPTVGGAGPEQIASIGRGEQVMALAWSPDGTRIAYARLPGEASEEASIRVMSATGANGQDVWRGPLNDVAGQLLAWLDDDHVAFASNDLVGGRAQLITVDLRSRASQPHGAWAATYLGPGSAARGTLLLLRGTATYAVQVGDRTAWRLAREHGRGVRARHLAGWTSDDHIVFAIGEPGKERIVRAGPGQALLSWPGTHDGVELPDTLAGEDLITHRVDQAAGQVVVERITPAGEHTELARVDGHAAGGDVVRCAGDRSAPCVIEDSDGRFVSWTELDPATGARGPRVHRRAVRERFLRSAAMSPDGRLLAVVDGGDTVTLIDRTTGEVESRSAGEGATLQSVGFSPGGDVWASAIGFRGRRFGLLSFDRYTSEKYAGGRISAYPSSRGDSREDALRWFSRPSPSPDGKRVAVGTLDVELEVWRADGL